MGKKIDKNGFLTYENTVFFREGVFEYLGREIDPSRKYGTEPERIYKVYRPKSEITKKEFVESLNQKPVVEDHTVIGTGEGMMKPEDKNCGGVLSDVKAVGNELHGRVDIWSTRLIDAIRKGKRELSLCYICKYKPQKGMFGGEAYDFIQFGLECGNHLALVDEARNGHDCRVMDGMFACDCKIQLGQPEEENMDISKLSADELVEAIKDCSDECKSKLKDFLNTPTEDEIKAAEEARKKEEEEAASKAAEAAAKKAAEDAEAAKKAEEEKAAACDAAVAAYKSAVALASAVSEKAKAVFGTVTCDGISNETELAEKVCSLDSAPASIKGLKGAEALSTLKGYLAACDSASAAAARAADSVAKAKRSSFGDYFKSL